jgi:predicted NUDIX family phosphoesterase
MNEQSLNQYIDQSVAPTSKDLEMILVVKREHLLPEGEWHGIKEVCFDQYTSIIDQHKEFIPRGIAEQDPTYKQIIPYLVFHHEDLYFLMQRSATASEERLQNKYSLGIGGHIRQEDITGQSLFDWARREFYEEVSYEGSVSVKPLGIINDDTNAVGQVHIGFVFLVEGIHSTISVKSELKSGSLVPLEECMQYNKYLESWSQMVLACLLDKKYGTTPAKCCCG